MIPRGARPEYRKAVEAANHADQQIEVARRKAAEAASRAWRLVELERLYHDVVTEVSVASGIARARILQRDRYQATTNARWSCWWLLREHGLSLPEIGKLVGRDHTTVMSALRRLDESPARVIVDKVLASRLRRVA